MKQLNISEHQRRLLLAALIQEQMQDMLEDERHSINVPASSLEDIDRVTELNFNDGRNW